MTATATAVERRARRLVRWYPRSWRERYGDEFCAMLEYELAERPHSVAREVNVVWSGLVARTTSAGLAGLPGDRDVQARRSLAWVAGSLAAFLCFGLAMWSQLVVDWQWTPPRTQATTLGTVAMSIGIFALGAIGAAALAPVLAAIAVRMWRRQARGLARPVTLAIASAAVLAVGAHRFQNGWPGTGGHPWAHQGLVPGGVAAFTWAATLAVTSYWAHPGALQTFPAPEVVWMVVSPVAMVGLAAGAVATLRRLQLGPRAQRAELRLGEAASVAMALVLFGALSWVTDRSPRPRSIPTDLFHVGAIDLVGAGVMALALVCTLQASRRGVRALGLSS